jgi:hypothetical protein
MDPSTVLERQWLAARPPPMSQALPAVAGCEQTQTPAAAGCDTVTS